MTPPTTPAGLDFAGVRQQYPAAFAALIAYQKANNPFTYDETELGQWVMKQEHLHIPTNPRELFDFFDDAGIHLAVMTKTQAAGANGVCPTLYPTRTAAESAAFMAAFGKLEEILTT